MMMMYTYADMTEAHVELQLKLATAHQMPFHMLLLLRSRPLNPLCSRKARGLFFLLLLATISLILYIRRLIPNWKGHHITRFLPT